MHESLQSQSASSCRVSVADTSLPAINEIGMVKTASAFNFDDQIIYSRILCNVHCFFWRVLALMAPSQRHTLILQRAWPVWST